MANVDGEVLFPGTRLEVVQDHSDDDVEQDECHNQNEATEIDNGEDLMRIASVFEISLRDPLHLHITRRKEHAYCPSNIIPERGDRLSRGCH